VLSWEKKGNWGGDDEDNDGDWNGGVGDRDGDWDGDGDGDWNGGGGGEDGEWDGDQDRNDGGGNGNWNGGDGEDERGHTEQDGDSNWNGGDGDGDGEGEDDEDARDGDEEQGPSEHAYHQHVHPFQLMTEDPEGSDYYQIGDWHDTIDEGFTIRYQPTVFTGKMMIHCHNLVHEDEGMMGIEYIHPKDDQGTNECTCADGALNGVGGQDSMVPKSTTSGAATAGYSLDTLTLTAMFSSVVVFFF
jgi:hypothetical protein